LIAYLPNSRQNLPNLFAGLYCFSVFPVCWRKTLFGSHHQATPWFQSETSEVPDPLPVAGPELEETTPKEWQSTGIPITEISNVSRPTMTVYSPTN